MSWKSQAAMFLSLSAVFSLIGVIFPAGGYIGFDWTHFFGIHRLANFYMPWAHWVTDYLTWPLLIGFSLAGFTLAAFRKSGNKLSFVAAHLTLPLLWTLFLGQLDGLALLGVSYLPWLAPIALLKPHLTTYALFAKKWSLAAGLIVLAVSLAIWGFWPLRLLSLPGEYQSQGFTQVISLSWLGVPFFLATAWFSRGDEDMLMLSGAFLTPNLIPYHLIVVMPAIARLSAPAAILAALVSWLPLLANWVGPWGWKLAWVSVAWVWLCLAYQRYRGAHLLAK